MVLRRLVPTAAVYKSVYGTDGQVPATIVDIAWMEACLHVNQRFLEVLNPQ
jgi:hypothetical protein